MASLSSNFTPETIVFREEAKSILVDLYYSMKELEQVHARLLKSVHPNYSVSARNLLHYLQLRNKEIRPLQSYLHASGLSSFTSSESHTMYQLRRVLSWFGWEGDKDDESEVCSYNQAVELRNAHLARLLGKNGGRDIPHIMVTLSPELTEDHDLIKELLKEGMTVARINCAHDTPDVWLRMINQVRSIAKKNDRSCKIYMDLSGPRMRVVEVKAKPNKGQEGLPLMEGDLLEISPKSGEARPARYHRDKTLHTPARIVVQPSNLTLMMRPGERIFFDDGKFEGKIVKSSKDLALVEIVRISTKKPYLRVGRGVNLPDSKLDIPSLTREDLHHLSFIALHADLVGYSFVSSPNDVAILRSQLKKYKHNPPSIILKIERLSAVENLPALLFEGMKSSSFGVMIARGDLAVEIGFERLSEVQQQILWICEAAHVPVIWATQVLENLNKTGFATRSEITDAAISSMAECVMLNKGRYVVKAVKTLLDILTRFSDHTDKKRFTFRPLSIASRFVKGDEKQSSSTSFL